MSYNPISRLRTVRLCVAAGLTVGLLGACTLPTDDWRIVEQKRDIKTEWQVDRAYVRFLDRAIEPIEGDLNRLTRFLVERDVKETDRLQVTGSGAQDPYGFEAERVRNVAEHLRALGYKPRVIPPVRRAVLNPLGVDSVRVTVGRFIARGPSCPDWTHPSAAGSKNQSSSNHGCSDKANLASMIDDPRDLVSGRGGGSRLLGDAGVISAAKDISAIDAYTGSGALGAVAVPAGAGVEAAGVAGGNLPSASGTGTLP
jgi:type IV pilus biogenesis protein CpaD/CtpE